MPPTITTQTPIETDTTASPPAPSPTCVSHPTARSRPITPGWLVHHAQREQLMTRPQLNAEIVSEFSDPGKSTYVDLHKRTGFLAMLDELKERNEHDSTRVDYVIVWSLSRWARNKRTTGKPASWCAGRDQAGEHQRADDRRRQRRRLLHRVHHRRQNQYESMQTSENVKRSIYQKAKNGGTYGWTRLGYLNEVTACPMAAACPSPYLTRSATTSSRPPSSSTLPANTLSPLSRQLYRSVCAAGPQESTTAEGRPGVLATHPARRLLRRLDRLQAWHARRADVPGPP